MPPFNFAESPPLPEELPVSTQLPTVSSPFNFAQSPPLPEELPVSTQLPAVSPPQLPSSGNEGRKERRNPSITPRKFNRFFTPRSRSQSHGSVQLSSARQALLDITGQ